MAIPQITDRKLLRTRLKRALRSDEKEARFLIEHAMDDIDNRLTAVARQFSKALVINSFSGDAAKQLTDSGKADMAFSMEPVALAADMTNRLAFVGDEEFLPVAPASVGLIVSPLTLQFVNDLPGALLQIRQALKPDGLFLGSLLGGSSLTELRHVFAETETGLRGGASPRVLPFSDIRDLGGLMQRAGFALAVADRDVLTVRYDSAFDLMRDLKSMGASNTLTERDRMPVGRAMLADAAERYRRLFSDPDGRVRATFEIVSLSGWAPHESQQKPAARGSAQVSLAEFLERK